MIPTPIGAVIIVVALLLMFRPAVEMLIFVLLCSLFAGSSALDAVVLGHSSIPPVILALGFLALRLCRRDYRRTGAVGKALRTNAWLVSFCLYGAASALILPRIFAGRLSVIPMQHANGFQPLAPSSQNLTQAFYLVGTGIAAVVAGATLSRAGAEGSFTKAVVPIAWVHIITGVADEVASIAHINGLFDFLRNGAYAQLDQEVSTFHRIAGMTPEPSAYAAIGVIFLAFTTELWLRGVDSVRTGLTAVAMAIMLLASTSSTAYAFLLAYALLLIIRVTLVPRALDWKRSIALLAVIGIGGVSSLMLLITKPGLSQQMTDVVLSMTVNKGESLSALERGIWARQGLDLLVETRALGVGIGSFRSSNLFTAILGSMGPACLVVLLIYVVQVFKPARISTWRMGQNRSVNTGAAAAWTTALMLIPAAFSSPSADPGVFFAIFAGVSLALRTSKKSCAGASRLLMSTSAQLPSTERTRPIWERSSLKGN